MVPMTRSTRGTNSIMKGWARAPAPHTGPRMMASYDNSLRILWPTPCTAHRAHTSALTDTALTEEYALTCMDAGSSLL